MGKRYYYVITGGTMKHVAPHFSLCAPAYGTVGSQVADALGDSIEARYGEWSDHEVVVVRTKMALACEQDDGEYSTEERVLFRAAGIPYLETNEDLDKVLGVLAQWETTQAIVMAAAVCDWEFAYLVQKTDGPETGEDGLRAWSGQDFGKQMPRLKTEHGEITAKLRPTNKLIGKIRSERKDIFLVGFKATTGMSEDEQYIAGLGLLKNASCNLVLSNDVHARRNMIITPEEARYHVGYDRAETIKGLAEMVIARAGLTFTRSTVVEGASIPWDSDAVPDSLRTVVNHCIERGAYKPFQGKTVGHFATRGPEDGIIYTSRRKSNFNRLPEDGLLRIDVVDDDRVIAHGAKPSVGGQSQRIIFSQHPDVDCIVHFHSPLKPIDQREGRNGGPLPVREQKPYECGSHECGRNTSEGLAEVRPGIKAVFLDEHGPNICFGRDEDPARIIEFIEAHFDLSAKTGGPVALP